MSGPEIPPEPQEQERRGQEVGASQKGDHGLSVARMNSKQDARYQGGHPVPEKRPGEEHDPEDASLVKEEVRQVESRGAAFPEGIVQGEGQGRDRAPAQPGEPGSGASPEPGGRPEGAEVGVLDEEKGIVPDEAVAEHGSESEEGECEGKKPEPEGGFLLRG
jgi:hypothetical protein